MLCLIYYDEPYESDPITPYGESFDPDVEGELKGYYEFSIYDDLHADDHCMLKVTEITLTYYC